MAAESEIQLTTYRVVISADDEAHARWLREALTNDGYRVSVERQQMVSKDGMVSIHREGVA